MDLSQQQCDLAVIGGGSAGLAAALAAAREGAVVLLVERHSMLGGMGTAALVHTFCGLYHPDIANGPVWLHEGIPTEIGTKMMELTSQTSPDLAGGVYYLRQHPTLFATLADELCRAEPTLTVACDVEVLSVTASADGWTLTVSCGGRISNTQAGGVIDTTGDASLSHAVGAQFQLLAPAERLFRPAYVTVFQNIASALDDEMRLRIAGEIVKQIKTGTLPRSLLGASFRQSPFHGEAFLTVDLEGGGDAWNPSDATCRAQVESEGREAALALWRHLRQNNPVFQNCPPPSLPAQPGIRESTRWRGDYILTADDLMESRRFDDEVALAGWPMELRETARGPRFRFFKRPEPAGIPAKCLFNSQVPGLWFAGRCVSSDHEALASLRVMGTCMATGQAAGRLAAKALSSRH